MNFEVTKIDIAQIENLDQVQILLEFSDLGSFPATGETGKLYLAQDTNTVYLWDGTQYNPISGESAGPAVQFMAEEWSNLSPGPSNLQLSYFPIINSENLSINKHLLTYGIDYSVNGSIIVLNTTYTDGFNWNVRINYAHQGAIGVGVAADIVEDTEIVY